MPSVSIITPSRGRQMLLRHQHLLLLRQQEQDYEWLILDDSPAPSSYFTQLDDPRIHYRHHGGEPQTIGLKRNILAEAASSPVIAHFDDDDYYGPRYLKTMLSLMAGGADIVKLSGWYLYSVPLQQLAYWDTEQIKNLNFKINPEALTPVKLNPESASAVRHKLGFGFSYVYRKAVWEKTSFPDTSAGEDYDFIQAALAAGARLELWPDNAGLMLHILGRDNMSECYPQYLLPPWMMDGRFRDAAPLLSR